MIISGRNAPRSNYAGTCIYNSLTTAQEVRRLMSNLKQQDSFRQKFEKPIIVSESKVNDYIVRR